MGRAGSRGKGSIVGGTLITVVHEKGNGSAEGQSVLCTRLEGVNERGRERESE